MPVTYEHTQIGRVTIVTLIVAILVTLVIASTARQAPLAIVVALLAVLLTQFATMTTRVADGVLSVRMGAGIFRRRIALTNVRQVAVINHLWVWGWGIRWTPRGWQWNISGTRGVELTYGNGHRFRVGSDEPEALAAAIASWLDKGANVHL